MNIEEERKAFEVWSLAEGYECTDEMLACWLAAKAHAEEMAKPVATLKPGKDGGWWIYYWSAEPPQCEVSTRFHFKKDAERWAKDNGYRVVSE